MTRTQNSFLNFITGSFSSFLSVVLSFVTRSVFLRTLGENYLGIGGLFSNILSLLSLTELGFGTAIVFRLYKPIEQGDRHRMQVLMKLYRRVYSIIGWIVVGLGLCLIPLLPKLIRDYDKLITLGLNPVFIFLLYLFESASSYWFFAYKSAFVNATQKGYLLTVMGYAVSLASSLAKVIVLIVAKDFVAFLVTAIFFGLVRNLMYAWVCNRRYPFLKEKVDDSVSREELKDFFKDCTALLLYKINNVVLRASDNLVLSSFLGLRYVAFYANYVSLRSNLSALLNSFISAIQASLGSLYATGKLEWSRLTFRTVIFFTVWVYGVGAIGLVILSDDFIRMWLGPRFVVTSWTVGNTVIPTPVAFFAGIDTFALGIAHSLGGFRSAMGLFQQLKYRPVISMVVNLVINLLLVRYLGIAACFLSTIVATVSVNLVVDPVIIHRVALKQSPKGYFLRNAVYVTVLAVSGLLCWWLCGLIPLTGVIGFIVHGCVCVAVPCAAFFLCFRNTMEFRFLWKSCKDLLHSRMKSKKSISKNSEDIPDA